MVQNRIEDAGFEDINIIPLGTDRVFIHSSSNTEVSTIIEGAHEFFAHFFTNTVRWDKKVVPF